MANIEKNNISNIDINKIIDLIKAYKNILLLTHVKPDGDAVGAVFALARALKKINLEAKILFEDYNRKFGLIATQRYDLYVNKDWADLIIVLDCGSKNRLGKHEALLDNNNKLNNKAKLVINIDHHVSNDYFADYNYVDAEASSTCEIIYELIKNMNLDLNLLDEKIAAALYAGIISDTGCFRHNCTTPKTHLITADLIKFNFDFSKIYSKLMLEKSLDEINFLDLVIKNLEIIKDLNLAISYLTFEQINKANNKFTGGLIDFIKNISGIETAVMILETEKKICKLSFRSNYLDVNNIAKKFDGGGHKLAAGGLIKSSIREAKEKIIKAVGDEIKCETEL